MTGSRATCIRRVFAIGVMLATHAVSAADTEALKQQILALAQTVRPTDYAFTRRVQTDQTEGDNVKHRVVVESYNPGKPVADRWTLLSIDGKAPTAEESKSAQKDAPKRKVASYGRMADYFSGGVASSTDAQGRVVFRLTNLPRGSVTILGRDVSENSTAEAFVDPKEQVPFVEQIRFTLNRATRIKVVANVEEFTLTIRYRLLPDGRPVPVEQTSDGRGSLLGRSGKVHSEIKYFDHRRVSQ
jgi:hypothetical protein